MRLLYCLLLVFSLAACQGAESTASSESNAVDANTEEGIVCKKEELQYLIGQPESVLAESNIVASKNLRILRADGFATQDYSENRTNIVIGTDGKISDITCG